MLAQAIVAPQYLPALTSVLVYCDPKPIVATIRFNNRSSNNSRKDTVVSFSEYVNGTLCSVKGEEFFHQQSYYQLLKKNRLLKKIIELIAYSSAIINKNLWPVKIQY
jgi:hypothetical protein